MKKVITFLSCLLLITMSAKSNSLDFPLVSPVGLFDNLYFEQQKKIPPQDNFETDDEYNARYRSVIAKEDTFYIESYCTGDYLRNHPNYEDTVIWKKVYAPENYDSDQSLLLRYSYNKNTGKLTLLLDNTFLRYLKGKKNKNKCILSQDNWVNNPQINFTDSTQKMKVYSTYVWTGDEDNPPEHPDFISEANEYVNYYLKNSYYLFADKSEIDNLPVFSRKNKVFQDEYDYDMKCDGLLATVSLTCTGAEARRICSNGIFVYKIKTDFKRVDNIPANFEISTCSDIAFLYFENWSLYFENGEKVEANRVEHNVIFCDILGFYCIDRDTKEILWTCPGSK